MTDDDAIAEILSLYKKHGWTLRRVLLSPAFRADRDGLFGLVDVRDAEIDAAWFSRPSRSGLNAWELRRLTGSPLALFRQVADDASDEERESILGEAEAQLKLAA